MLPAGTDLQRRRLRVLLFKHVLPVAAVQKLPVLLRKLQLLDVLVTPGGLSKPSRPLQKN